MKTCPQCSRTYDDETFFFCLFDGVKLSDVSDLEVTELISGSNSWDSILTVVSKPNEGAFKGSHVFEQIATDGVVVKKLSQYEDRIEIAFKVVVKNLAKKRKDIFVELQAVDDEGFEVENHTITGKLKSGEIKTLSEKTGIDEGIYKNIKSWLIKDISQYD